MIKTLLHILAAVGIGYYAYRTVKKALQEPPDETKYYSSFGAAIASGADPDDDWLYTDDADMDGNIPF